MSTNAPQLPSGWTWDKLPPNPRIKRTNSSAWRMDGVGIQGTSLYIMGDKDVPIEIVAALLESVGMVTVAKTIVT